MDAKRPDTDATLPLFFLYRKVLFPHCSMEVKLKPGPAGDLRENGEAVVLPVRTMLGLAFARGRTAVRARVAKVDDSGGLRRVEFQGLGRVKILRITDLKYAAYLDVPEGHGEADQEWLEKLRRKAQELVFLINVDTSDRLIHLLEYIVSLGQLSDFLANYFVLRFSRRQRLIRIADPVKRADLLISLLDKIIKAYKKKKGIGQ